MSQFIWGDLQKSLDDDETIEQAIARVVAEHEADPAAHQGEGESLQNHKANEILDHPMGSVKNDKNSSYSFLYNLLFTDFADWQKSAGFSRSYGGDVVFQSGSGTGNFNLTKEFNYHFTYINSSVSFYFSLDTVLIAYDWNDNCYISFGLGYPAYNDNAFVGFEVKGNKLFTVCYKQNGSRYSKEILGVNPLDESLKNYYFVYDATLKELSFFISNNLVDVVSYELQDLSFDFDLLYRVNIRLNGVSVASQEFYFYSPKLSIDYTY